MPPLFLFGGERLLGLYIHVPFCVSKCPYCDFYSLTGATDEQKDTYVQALIRSMMPYAEETADTLYFGGGTPSLLGGKRLAALIDAARERFSLTPDAEITMEANPADDLYDTLCAFAQAGGNRVSLGMQAANDAHLRTLGRRHTAEQVERAVQAVKRSGIANFSLDLMLGTPRQTPDDVIHAVERCADLGASHVSAYLLKIEPNTPYGQSPPALPNEDDTVLLYHTAAEALEKHGFAQYEISNFAKPHCQSRHNRKYWELEPYLGFGPAAHSFYNGKRFYYPRSLTAFLAGEPPIAEEDETIAVGSAQEYAMLRLRLTEGLREEEFVSRFGIPIPQEWRTRTARYPETLVKTDDDGIRLTREGMLVSDALIARIIW